jgi:hypothetical protein
MTAGAMLVSNEFMTEMPIDIIVCNFIKTTETIEWIKSTRTKVNIDDYKAKINHFIYLMYINGYHPKRSLYAFHSPCRWCDFKETCLDPDKTRIPEGLKEMLKTFEI